ncbi:MAG: restriction endonuclease, partial [archaeon]
KLLFNVFNVFRDRQITKKITKDKGKYRVLKSRNLSKDGSIINIGGYDSYTDNISKLAVSKFLNKENIVIAPNLSYYPRAGFLPKNSIADGSLAILTPKNHSQKITKKQLEYFSTEEFEKFYRIARHYGTRSLNIDSNSVFFWGLLKENLS